MARLEELIGARVVKTSNTVWGEIDESSVDLSFLVVELKTGERIKLVPDMIYKSPVIRQEGDVNDG